MRKLILTPDNEIKEQVGLSKLDFKPVFKQQLPTRNIRQKSSSDIKEFSISPINILEGIYKISDGYVYYKCSAKKVRVPRLDATIRTNLAIKLKQKHIEIPHYNIWYPETLWKINLVTGTISLLKGSKSSMLPAVFLNLHRIDSDNSYTVCTGQSLEGISLATSKDILENCKMAINTLLCAKMNLDLSIRDSTYEVCGNYVSYIHKLFLNIAYSQEGNINTPEEANAWWKKYYTNKQFADKMIKKYDVFDEGLKEAFKL